MSPQEKAAAVRLLILDVDGVMTTGTLYYGTQGLELKGFHIHDGLGIKLLQRSGIHTAVISGKKSEALAFRLKELEIEHAYLGYEDKRPAYESLRQTLKLTDQQIAYMGDDLPDLPMLLTAGLAITVADAPSIIKKHADIVTKKRGGRGAVREVCDFILEAQGKYESVVQSYLSK